MRFFLLMATSLATGTVVMPTDAWAVPPAAGPVPVRPKADIPVASAPSNPQTVTVAPLAATPPPRPALPLAPVTVTVAPVATAPVSPAAEPPVVVVERTPVAGVPRTVIVAPSEAVPASEAVRPAAPEPPVVAAAPVTPAVAPPIRLVPEGPPPVPSVPVPPTPSEAIPPALPPSVPPVPVVAAAPVVVPPMPPPSAVKTIPPLVADPANGLQPNAPSVAPDPSPPRPGPYVSASLGYGLIDDINRTVLTVPSRLLVGGGLSADGAIGYRFLNGLRIEVEGSYDEGDLFRLKAPKVNTKVTGDTRIYTGMLDILYDTSPILGVRPFIGVGLGLAHTDTHNLTLRQFSLTAPDESHDDFGFQALAGFSLPLSKNLFLVPSYRYLQVQSDDPIRVHSFRLGLRYQF